jgi:hypothetical protein
LQKTQPFLGRPSKNKEVLSKSWAGHGPGQPQRSSARLTLAKKKSSFRASYRTTHRCVIVCVKLVKLFLHLLLNLLPPRNMAAIKFCYSDA